MPKGKESSKLKKTFKIKKQLSQKKNKNLRKKKSFSLKKKDKCKQFRGGSVFPFKKLVRKLTSDPKEVLKKVIKENNINTQTIKHLKYTKKCGRFDNRCSNDRILFYCYDTTNNCIFILMFKRPLMGFNEDSQEPQIDYQPGTLTLNGQTLTYVNGFMFQKRQPISYGCNNSYEIFLRLTGFNLETEQTVEEHLYISFHFNDPLIRNFLVELDVTKFVYIQGYTIKHQPNLISINSNPPGYIDETYLSLPLETWRREFTNLVIQMMTKYQEKYKEDSELESFNLSKLRELKLKAVYPTRDFLLFQVPSQDKYNLNESHLVDFFQKNFIKKSVN